MENRTITLPADLVDRLEILAENRGRSVEDMVSELLGQYVPSRQTNWALAIAEGMEVANIDWLDDPDASVNSRESYKRHLYEKWQRTQSSSEQDA